MGWKKLTFILIPHSHHDKVKQFRLHKFTLLGVAAFLIVSIFVMIFYIIGFKEKTFFQQQTKEIAVKNKVLEKHISFIDSSLSNMKTQVAHLESTNKEIMQITEIPDMDLQLNTLLNFDEKGDARISSRSAYAIIDRLDKRSSSFEKNFNEIYKKCMEKPDFIRRVPSIRPASGYISKEFGKSFDIFSKQEIVYQGIDIHNVEGTPVIATADGIIEKIDTNEEFGRHIIIDHQNGYKTRYAHLQYLLTMDEKVHLREGDKVKRGQQIGTIGRTGIPIAVVSAHLMYSVFHNGIPVNPTEFFFAFDFADSTRQAEIIASQTQPQTQN